MKSCEATGKNIEQAIENALLQLRASREDVDIKILSEGGFLKKAKVLVSISADALEKYEKKEQVRKALAEDEARAENDEDFAENFLKKKVSSGQKESAETPEKFTKFGEKIEKNGKKTEKNDAKAEKDAKGAQNAENGADGLRGAENAQNAEQGAKKSHVKIYADEEISSSTQKRKGVQTNFDVQTADEQGSSAEGKTLRNRISGEEFLNGVMKSLGLEGEIEKTEDEKFVRYSLSGENMNDLIGYHGECMLALSYLMNTACAAPEHKRIVLDVSDYRAKRAQSLIALAQRIADKVAKSGRYYKLEPMDASERKIIHTALQDDERVTTLSKGEEPHRYLMVFPKEYSDRD